MFGGGNLWQHSLSLTAERDSDWAKQISSGKLPPGKYLAKMYIDQTNKLQDDFTAELGKEDFVGKVELESQWLAGYGKMTIVKLSAE